MSNTQDSAGAFQAVTGSFIKANKIWFDFVFGMQTAILGSMLEASNNMFEHVRSEVRVASEFASKIAEAHSAQGVRQACEDCVEHQSDVLREDGTRLFEQGDHFVARTADAVSGQPDTESSKSLH